MRIKKEMLPISSDHCYPLLDETCFAEQMDHIVLPFLSPLGEEGYFERIQNEPIFYRHYRPATAKGILVIAHGFTESSEKFLELIYYFVKEGYEVYAIDHREHGNSYRSILNNMSITHVEKFCDYVDDLTFLIQNIIQKTSADRPLYLFAHSMGGCIGALLLEQHPGLFRAAVLTAPMLEVNGGLLPIPVCKQIANYFIAKGSAKKCVFVHRDFNPKERFESTPGQSRPRYDYYFKKRLADKRLQNYGASYNWLLQSILAAEEVLDPENLGKVTEPVLLFQAGRDVMVRPRGQDRFVEGIKNGKMILVKDSKHEIYFGKNEIVSPYMNEIFRFFAEHP